MDRPFKLKRPASLAPYIIKELAKETYLIFNTKEDTVRCTRCGKSGKLSLNMSLFHNQKMRCPFCKSNAIAKESHRGRKCLTEYGRILWLQKRGRVTFAQLDEYDLTFTGDKPEVIFWPSAQFRFTKEKQEGFKHHPGGFWTPDHWEEMSKVKLPAPPSGIGYNSKYFRTYTHEPTLGNFGTDLKYADEFFAELNFDEEDGPYGLIGYLYNFLEYPSIEILEKAGFNRIVAEKALGSGCRYINWRSADLRKILKMNRKEIRDFREAGEGMGLLEKYKQVKEKVPGVEFNQLHLFDEYDWERRLARVRRIVPAEKAIAYLQNQKYASIGIYADYLEELRRLGEDLRDKKKLYPKNLQTAHAKSAQRLKVVLSEEQKRKFAENKALIYGAGEYRSGEFLIRPAESIEELNNESKALHHCVRTYADKVAEGRCVILFIRKTDAPDEPYFTLELSPELKIVQCRGKCNRSYPDEVAEFLRKWQVDILEKLKRKKKGEAASAA